MDHGDENAKNLRRIAHCALTMRAAFELLMEADEAGVFGNRCEADPCSTCTTLEEFQMLVWDAERQMGIDV